MVSALHYLKESPLRNLNIYQKLNNLTYLNNEIHASTSFQQFSHTQNHHLILSTKINTYNQQFH